MFIHFYTNHFLKSLIFTLLVCGENNSYCMICIISIADIFGAGHHKPIKLSQKDFLYKIKQILV